ncbi:MAG: hypothetical protein LBG81_05490, partial [Coriobacteriaceae bacterium]|nr:hypothetical protein [Coriobacteriaceae bacterium]
MDPRIVLCIDSESYRNPGLIGLEGESLDAQQWLRVFCSALEARRYLQKHAAAQEVWVASSDEVDPINLAAAIKKDSTGKNVYLLATATTGSLKSRANVAGIDAVLTQGDFTRRYSSHKQAAIASSDILLRQPPDDSPASFARQPSGGSSAALVQQPSGGSSAALVQQPSGGSSAALVQQPSGVRPGMFSLQCLDAMDPNRRGQRRTSAYVLTIASASGGSGKSTVAALSALFAQGLGHHTLLLDADFQFGDMGFSLGIEKPLTIDALLGDPSKISQLKPQGLFPALLAAPKCLEQSELAFPELPALLGQLRMCFDVIVVNTGAFWAEHHAVLLEQSTSSLFLV